MKDVALRKFIGLRGQAILHKPVGVEVHAAPCVLRQCWLQRENAAEPVGALFQIGVAEHQIVLDETGKSLLAEQAVRDVGTAENITLNGNR